MECNAVASWYALLADAFSRELFQDHPPDIVDHDLRNFIGPLKHDFPPNTGNQPAVRGTIINGRRIRCKFAWHGGFVMVAFMLVFTFLHALKKFSDFRHGRISLRHGVPEAHFIQKRHAVRINLARLGWRTVILVEEEIF
jgi:hypothetical protein